MGSTGIVTSTIVTSAVSATVNTNHADECEQIDPCLLFAPEREYSLTPPRSNHFSVLLGAPKVVNAFNLLAGESVVVEAAYGPKGGDTFTDYAVQGSVLTLAHPNTVLLIVNPGTYRLRFEGGADPTSTGDAVVVCQDADCCTAELMLMQAQLIGV